MRKIFLALLLFMHFCSLYSQNNGSGLSLGVLGIGVSSDTGWDGAYVHGRFLSLYFQTDYGLGIIASPLQYSAKIFDVGDYSLTFVNVSAYYDFLKEQEQFILGPVVSARAVEYNKPDFFEGRFGLQFIVQSLKGFSFLENTFFDRDFFALELGYKYNAQRRGFYVHLGVNVITALLYLGHFWGGI